MKSIYRNTQTAKTSSKQSFHKKQSTHLNAKRIQMGTFLYQKILLNNSRTVSFLTFIFLPAILSAKLLYFLQ